MNIEAGSTAFTDPLFHLQAYGLHNPVVQWCIEAGVYQPAICPDCHGTGHQVSRYGGTVWAYDADEEGALIPDLSSPIGWKRHPEPCRPCGGTGHRQDRAPHQADFEDRQSLVLAEQLGIRVESHKPWCAARPGRNRACRCILR